MTQFSIDISQLWLSLLPRVLEAAIVRRNVIGDIVWQIGSDGWFDILKMIQFHNKQIVLTVVYNLGEMCVIDFAVIKTRYCRTLNGNDRRIKMGTLHFDLENFRVNFIDWMDFFLFLITCRFCSISSMLVMLWMMFGIRRFHCRFFIIVLFHIKT